MYSEHVLTLDSRTESMLSFAQRMKETMKRKQTSCLVSSLDEFLKSTAKLDACVGMFIESHGMLLDVKQFVLQGNILDAYKNLVKLEKYRNDLLTVMSATPQLNTLAMQRFDVVERMANQIRDIIRLTLSNACDIQPIAVEQILSILNHERLLDSPNANPSHMMPNRPRKWTCICEQSLDDQMKHSKNAALVLMKKRLNVQCDTVITQEQCDYHEELLVLSKYLGEFHANQTLFEQQLSLLFVTTPFVTRTEADLAEGYILSAYERLLEAESVRFTLLSLTTNKESTASIRKAVDKAMQPLDAGWETFRKYAAYMCSRCVDVMRSEDDQPRTLLDHVLRLLDVDHWVDEQYGGLLLKDSTRAHCWRERCLRLIQRRIAQRIDVLDIETKANNQNWIARYLEICKMFITEDLCAAKRFLRAFPSEHQLYDRFVLFYHEGISHKLCAMVTNELDRREMAQLLDWIRKYPSLLGLPLLQIDVPALLSDHPLLPCVELDRLTTLFVSATENEVRCWAVKAIQQELQMRQKDGRDGVEEDRWHSYYTQLPYILFSIVHDQVSLASEISTDLMLRVLDVCVNQLIEATCFFQKEVIELQTRTYEDKQRAMQFTCAMVIIANDVDMCVINSRGLHEYVTREEAPAVVQVQAVLDNAKPKHNMRTKLKDAVLAMKDLTRSTLSSSSSSICVDCETSSEHESRHSVSSLPVQTLSLLPTDKNDESVEQSLNDKLHILTDRLQAILLTSVSALAEEVFDDLLELFQQLLGKKWLQTSHITDTICMTIVDYSSDHCHLRPQLRSQLLTRIQLKLVAQYLSSILTREMTCSNLERRRCIASALQRDAALISDTLQTVCRQYECAQDVDATKVLLSCASFMQLVDPNTLSVEATLLINTYPMLPCDLLFALIDARDDITSTESRAMAEQCCAKAVRSSGDPFSDLFELLQRERKPSQCIRDVVPRLRRRVRLSIAY